MAFSATESYFTLLLVPTDTLPEFDKLFLEYHRLLESLPRSNSTRPHVLLKVARLRIERWALSNQKSDLDKAITLLTESVLLFPTERIVIALYDLATVLFSRFCGFLYLKGPGDVNDLKSSIKYLRLLSKNFHSLEAFDISYANGDISSDLFLALSQNLVSTKGAFNPGEMAQGLEEMLPLIPELITADILSFSQELPIARLDTFGWTIDSLATEISRQEPEDIMRVFNRAIQVLQEAMVLNQDPRISYALAMCLVVRFETTHVMNDWKEAITNLDRVVASCSPGNNLTLGMEARAIMQISRLLLSRVNMSPTPENLEHAIHRLRTFVPYSLLGEDRTQLNQLLDVFTRKRFSYFGVAGNSGGTPPDPDLELNAVSYPLRRDETRSQKQEILDHLKGVCFAIINDETTDIEAAVEGSRQLISLHERSSVEWSPFLVGTFAGMLLNAYHRIKRLDYLNEAVDMYQDLRKIPATSTLGLNRFYWGNRLSESLELRFLLLHLPQDAKELMQLSSELANDDSGEVFIRFNNARHWALSAHILMNPSVSIAYETAMSLLQQTLVFCPTLQTKHRRLLLTHGGGRVPADYALYQISNGQVQQAIETIERGRTLIWSEMRGLRTSTDQLRTADPAIADKFSDINQRLESVTMSVAQSDDEMGAGRHGHSIGYLVLMQRRLLEERNTLISHIQSLPGLEDFLKPLSFDVLTSAAECGPVFIINMPSHVHSWSILLLLKDSPPYFTYTSSPSSFHDRVKQLKKELLQVRKEKGLDSKDYDLTLASVLSDLYELVGKLVIEILRKLKIPKKSRIWWCPTDVFCSLPLHAMGPIPSDDGNNVYFSDLYISSYTPSLSALIESRKRGSFDNSKPSILLVAQPDTLPGADGEITAIKAAKTTVTTLTSAMATPETVIEGLRGHRFAHFVCHGSLEIGKPFDASLELHSANLTLLEIVRSQLPAAEFAFLAACHTAELTEGSVADEGLHLAAAMQYCGFRSVVGTMWAMADTDGADLSQHFYKEIFADETDQIGIPYHERSARALQIAVKKLRKKRGMTLERWVNFVHYGA